MTIPPWEPKPDIWLLVIAVGGWYEWALRRLGPSRVGPGWCGQPRAPGSW